MATIRAVTPGKHGKNLGWKAVEFYIIGRVLGLDMDDKRLELYVNVEKQTVRINEEAQDEFLLSVKGVGEGEELEKGKWYEMSVSANPIEYVTIRFTRQSGNYVYLGFMFTQGDTVWITTHLTEAGVVGEDIDFHPDQPPDYEERCFMASAKASEWDMPDDD